MKIENMLLISRFIVFWFTHPLPDQTQTHKPTKIKCHRDLKFLFIWFLSAIKKKMSVNLVELDLHKRTAQTASL